MRGRQCPGSLYLLKTHPEFRSSPSAAGQNLFRQGHRVGKLAWNLFPDGLDLSPANFSDLHAWAARTEDSLKTSSVNFYEAAFLKNGMFCAADILHKENDSYSIYEVKSSTSLYEHYIEDAAVQYFILKHCGISLKNISIIYINREYQRGQTLDLKKLFRIESVLNEAESIQGEINNEMAFLQNMLETGKKPEFKIGPHCMSPRECDFKNYCWKDIPSPSVFEIAGMNYQERFALYDNGIINYSDFNDDALNQLTPSQKIQIVSGRSRKDYIQTNSLQEFINELQYPLHFLDFECMMQPVPEIIGAKPYQHIPFQYSLHIIASPDSSAAHKEFLADETTPDPRHEWILNLLDDINENGKILAYNASYETMILRMIADAFPELKRRIETLLPRFTDLALPFRKKYIYKPEMKGSFSIKNVLPAIFPDLKGYEHLNIADGLSAMNAFLGLREDIKNPSNPAVRKDLLEYCRMDTLAMVKILGYIQKILKNEKIPSERISNSESE
ncbi:MAG: DUF2779 domain-containing protein [Spirochaetia bacterium]|nr:DUF2779 domain-containing protein [Spirochaetia bacterium]